MALWVGVWAFGPTLGLNVPIDVLVYGTLILVVAIPVLFLWTVRRMRADGARLLAAHEGSAAFLSGIAAWPGENRAVRQRVIAVVASRAGLSFRDHEDVEVLAVPADRILSLELAPFQLRRGVRPFRVTTIDGETIEFTGPFMGDDLVDAVVALRTALGRAAG
jgi:hypothetical protein